MAQTYRKEKQVTEVSVLTGATCDNCGDKLEIIDTGGTFAPLAVVDRAEVELSSYGIRSLLPAGSTLPIRREICKKCFTKLVNEFPMFKREIERRKEEERQRLKRYEGGYEY